MITTRSPLTLLRVWIRKRTRRRPHREPLPHRRLVQELLSRMSDERQREALKSRS